MYAVISGTNRPGSNTRKVASAVRSCLQEAVGDEAVRLVDLQQLPAEIYDPASYATKPDAFAPFQETIESAAGIVTVVPEYNGSFPGALKYFIDMLRFPDSMHGVPVAFVGVAAGRWGAIRAVEQLQMVYQYRLAKLFPQRVFIPTVHEVVNDEGVSDDEIAGRLKTTMVDFAAFAQRNPR